MLAGTGQTTENAVRPLVRRLLCLFPVVQQYTLSAMKRYVTFFVIHQFVVAVAFVSHIQRIGCQPEKNYFTRWPIPLVVSTT